MLFTTKVLAAFALTSAVAQAAVVTYNWNITYVNANPDGLFERRVIGVNGQFPPPPIEVTQNDTLVINVINQIDEPTSLHCHGLFQTGNNQMDGPSMVTQCPIPPGANFTYTIPIEQHGTYWIHGHNKGHYVDGLRAPLIIHAINETYKYDAEYTLTFADWYHDEHSVLLNQYLSIFNPSGAEPIPKAGLINQMSDTKFNFVPGKTYRLRIINMSALAMFHFHIDGHEFDVIEVEGTDVQRYTTSTFHISAAQRYSILVTAKNDTSYNYVVHGDMDPMMFDSIPDDLVLNVTGTIVYNEASPLAPLETSDWADFDDGSVFVPVVPQDVTPPTIQHSLRAVFNVLSDYINKATFNDITYVMPKVPSLYTAMSMGNLSSNPDVYGKFAHPIILNHNDEIELIINNADAGNHPFHLHGHVFQLVGRSDGFYDGSTPYPYYNSTNPLRRDTVYVPSLTNAAIRFKASNPGVWLFHCHIEWHLQAGLAVTFIEAPDVMQQVLTVDPKHYEQCQALGIPYQGNAAGNQGLDLNGANLGPTDLPTGFTGKGIVALVFTIIAAILGLMVVVWYAGDDSKVIEEQVKKAKAKRALEANAR
ncbi:ferroxidase fet3 [Mortierella sp. AD094]|nr:ferroxidase fet3 [Mortierella sp. AD094]